MSPLLFILVLEFLLKRIQINTNIPGLKVKKQEYKYRAYADDIMLISEDPLNSLPLRLKKVNKFGELAGFQINYKKTKIICKNMMAKE